MIIRILAVGDITDPRSADHLIQNLWRVRREHDVDLAIVNAENAAFIGGASAEQMQRLLDGGADVLTGGNHTMQNLSAQGFMAQNSCALRPLNYPSDVAGDGYVILDVAGYRILVISVLGQVNMTPQLQSPLNAVNRLLERLRGDYDFAVMDFHAEATSEKVAAGLYYDGRIQVIFGTHTHVRTGDATVLPEGTGYITDIGMCGPADGVLGIRKDIIFKRMLTALPEKFEASTGPVVADACLFSLDTEGRRVVAVKQLRF